MTGSGRVVLLGFDAMDFQLTRELADAGRLPAFAQLLRTAAACPTRNPIGLFVGTLWSTFFTARSAARTGFYCWEEVIAGSYEKRLVGPSEIAGSPFWEEIGDAGRRVAVIDVPHAIANRPLNGIQVSEWGCHDRHLGLRSYPPELAEQLIERFGIHPVLGIEPRQERDFAPDDYVFRAGPHRTPEEETQLLEGLITGLEAKSRLSASILADEPWDLFISVFGETHAVGHQSWHLHDPAHPRHDPQLRRRLGDPVKRVYEQMDRVLAAHLDGLDDDTTVLVLLSHGMGAHHDGTHLLPEILRRLDTAYFGHVPRSWQGRALGRLWRGLPATVRQSLGGTLAAALKRRAHDRRLRPVRDDETEAERAGQRFFMAPNNYVFGGVRFNLRGREPAGKLSPGPELERVRDQLTADLLAMVNVETGAPVVRAIERTDAHYQREELDSLPDLLLDWNHDHPIETVWSPTFGLVHGTYEHWRTGDHTPTGLLLARGPGLDPRRPPAAIGIEDLGPSIAARLGVTLKGIDGSPVSWLAQPTAAIAQR